VQVDFSSRSLQMVVPGGGVTMVGQSPGRGAFPGTVN